MIRKLLEVLIWVGVWASYAFGFMLILISALIVNLRDPAFVALLVFFVAALMIGYWALTDFPEAWKAMH